MKNKLLKRVSASCLAVILSFSMGLSVSAETPLEAAETRLNTAKANEQASASVLETEQAAYDKLTAAQTSAESEYNAAVSDEAALEEEAETALSDTQKKAAEDAASAASEASEKQAALETAKERQSAAQSEYDEAKAASAADKAAYEKIVHDNPTASQALEDAQNAYDSAAGELNSAQDAYDSAKAASDEADKKAEDTSAALAAAQSAADTAASEKNSAQSAYDQAKSDYEAAEAAYEEALKASGDDEEVKKLQNAYDQAKSELDQAEEALKTASSAEESAKSEYNAALEEQTKAQQAYDAANNASTAAESELAALQSNGETITSNITAKTNEIAQLQSDQKTAAEKVASTKEALDAANTALKTAQSNKTAADEAVAAAQKAVDEYTAPSTDKSSLSFFQWLAKKEGVSESVKTDAENAVSILEGNATGSLLNSGSNISGTITPYATIIQSTNIGAENDATSFENFKAALNWIPEGNQKRASENLAALKVSSALMAMSEVNANYMTAQGVLNHTRAFNGLENAAYSNAASSGGYAYAKSHVDQNDPYTGWYDFEKLIYDYKQQNPNATDAQIRSALKDSAAELGFDINYQAIQTGHYLTLTDRNGVANYPLTATITGFGLASRQDLKNSMYSYSRYYSQHFAGSSTYNQYQTDGVDYETYKGYVEEYENSSADDSEKAALDQALADAKAAQTTRASELETAQNSQKTAQDAYDAAINAQKDGNFEKKIQDAEKQLEDLNSQKTTNEAAIEAKQKDVENKKAALDTAAASKTAADKKASEKKTAADNATSAVTAAAAERDIKKSAADAAQSALEDYTKGNNLEALKNDRDLKKTALDTAKTEQKKAAEAETAANETLATAKGNAEAAEEEQTKAKAALTDAENTLNEKTEAKNQAETALNTAKENAQAIIDAKEKADASALVAEEKENAKNEADLAASKAETAYNEAQADADTKTAQNGQAKTITLDQVKAGTVADPFTDLNKYAQLFEDASKKVTETKQKRDEATNAAAAEKTVCDESKKAHDDAVTELNAAQAAYDALVVEDTQVSLAQTEFIYGDHFEDSNVKITLTYKDGHTESVPLEQMKIVEPDMQTKLSTDTIITGGSEEREVKVTYNEKEYILKLSLKPVSYEITEGAGASLTRGEYKTQTFKSTAENDKFVQVMIDGSVVAEDKYDRSSGSTIITLHKDYLDSLVLGSHNLMIVSNDGKAETTFTVKEKASSVSSSTNTASKDMNITLQPKGTQKVLADRTIQTSLGNGTYYDQNHIVWDGFGNKIGTLDANTGNVVPAKKTPVQTFINHLVPNTGDEGITGSVVSLAVSAVIAVTAALILKRR